MSLNNNLKYLKQKYDNFNKKFVVVDDSYYNDNVVNSK